jgi:hypothetical protein
MLQGARGYADIYAPASSQPFPQSSQTASQGRGPSALPEARRLGHAVPPPSQHLAASELNADRHVHNFAHVTSTGYSDQDTAGEATVHKLRRHLPHMLASVPETDMSAWPADDSPGYDLDGRIAEIQQEMDKLRMEREHAASVRKNLEQAERAMQQERDAFETHQVWARQVLEIRPPFRVLDDACLRCMTFVLTQPPAVQASVRMAMEVEREREQERLRRERANLERQSRTLAKLPTRKERAEIEAMEAVVEQSRKEAKAKDSRHKLTVERLRRQIVSLQVMRHDIT